MTCPGFVTSVQTNKPCFSHPQLSLSRASIYDSTLIILPLIFNTTCKPLDNVIAMRGSLKEHKSNFLNFTPPNHNTKTSRINDTYRTMSKKRQKKSNEKEAGLVHSIYRISLGKLFGDQGEGDTSLNRKEFDEIKDRFFQEINAGKNEPCEQYQEYEMREDKATSTEAAFYVKCVKADIKEFADFYSPLLSDKEALNGFLKDNEPKYLSTILLLQTHQKRLYAVASGFARYSIQSIIEKNFGLKVLNREIEGVRVSGRTVHPLEGVVQSLQENYNQLVDVNSIITNTELIGKVKGVLKSSELLGNLIDSKKKEFCTVTAMDQIRIGTKVPFASLCQFLQYFDEKVGDDATIGKISGINRVEEQTAKKIWDVIYQKLLNVENKDNKKDDLCEVYIFPPEDVADTYLEANKYKLFHINLEDDLEHEITEMPLLLKEIIPWRKM